jgi:hypothetical protein
MIIMKKIKYIYLSLFFLIITILFSVSIITYYRTISSCSYLTTYNNNDLISLLKNKNKKIFILTNSIAECDMKKYTSFLIFALDSNFSKEDLLANVIRIKTVANHSLNQLYHKNYPFNPEYSLDEEQTNHTINIWKNLYITGQLN